MVGVYCGGPGDRFTEANDGEGSLRLDIVERCENFIMRWLRHDHEPLQSFHLPGITSRVEVKVRIARMPAALGNM